MAPVRAGLPGLNGGGTAAVVPPCMHVLYVHLYVHTDGCVYIRLYVRPSLHKKFLADHANGCAFGTVLRPSVCRL